jgi:exosortase A-associated hydrolase 2
MTTAAAPIAQSGSFVDGAGGSRLRLVSAPARGRSRGTVVLAPAFAEEMNKSRRMCARLARALAKCGYRVIQGDLAGCGDSAGALRDATWEQWIDNLRSDLALADAAGPAWLWCVRAGALLARPVLAGYPEAQLLLWQPVMSGAQHLQHFLRLHTGARITGSAKSTDRVTPAQALRAGAVVEVGGYELAPALAQGLEHATFDLDEAHRGRVIAFEVSADDPPAIGPALQRAAQRLAQRGLQVNCAAVGGPPFWQTQEIEDNDGLLDASIAQLVAETAHA